MENITKTIERLVKYIEYKDLSLNKFSLSIGVSNSYLHKMIKNKASIGSDIIENILRIYPELNPAWLLTGEGDMLRRPGEKGENGEAARRVEKLEAENEELKAQVEMLKQLVESKDQTIDALQRAIKALEKQETVTQARTEVVEGAVGRKG